MSNITQTEKPKPLTVKSLKDLEASQKGDDIEELKVFVDRSSSMMEGFAGGKSNESRAAAAQRAVDTLYAKTDWSICQMEVYAFDDHVDQVVCSESERPEIPRPRGGTDFVDALQVGLDRNATRMILCSDGEANCFPENQVAECASKGIPIDTVFIGGQRNRGAFFGSDEEPENYGEKTLREISDRTNGKFCTVDNAEDLVEAFAQLETSERLLISHQPGKSDEVIKL